MAVGILLAGGSGQRMGTSVPKQFIEVDGRPIVCYPLAIMEKHPQISSVEIVCVEGFTEVMWDLVRRYGFSKVKWVTPGGATCQESTWNGLKNLRGKIPDDEVVLIHMSSYPLASADIITGCIESANAALPSGRQISETEPPLCWIQGLESVSGEERFL